MNKPFRASRPATAYRTARKKAPTMPRVFSDCRRLFDKIIDAAEQYPKQIKYTIGEQTIRLCSSLLGHISHAYAKRDKADKARHLMEFEGDFHHLKALIKVAFERQWVKGQGKMTDMAELLVSIESQHAAWMASAQGCADNRPSGEVTTKPETGKGKPEPSGLS